MSALWSVMQPVWCVQLNAPARIRRAGRGRPVEVIWLCPVSVRAIGSISPRSKALRKDPMIRVAMLSFWHVHARDYARQATEHPGVAIVAAWDEDPGRGRAQAAELDVP